MDMEVWEAQRVTYKECGIGLVVVNENLHSRHWYTEPHSRHWYTEPYQISVM